jgi:hypothetical protein
MIRLAAKRAGFLKTDRVYLAPGVLGAVGETPRMAGQYPVYTDRHPWRCVPHNSELRQPLGKRPQQPVLPPALAATPPRWSSGSKCRDSARHFVHQGEEGQHGV